VYVKVIAEYLVVKDGGAVEDHHRDCDTLVGAEVVTSSVLNLKAKAAGRSLLAFQFVFKAHSVLTKSFCPSSSYL